MAQRPRHSWIFRGRFPRRRQSLLRDDFPVEPRSSNPYCSRGVKHMYLGSDPSAVGQVIHYRGLHSAIFPTDVFFMGPVEPRSEDRGRDGIFQVRTWHGTGCKEAPCWRYTMIHPGRHDFRADQCCSDRRPQRVAAALADDRSTLSTPLRSHQGAIPMDAQSDPAPINLNG